MKREFKQAVRAVRKLGQKHMQTYGYHVSMSEEVYWDILRVVAPRFGVSTRKLYRIVADADWHEHHIFLDQILVARMAG